MSPRLMLVALAALMTPGLVAAGELPLQPGAPKLLLVGVEVDDSIGNADGSLEPGETVNLRVKLYNDGNERASSVFGTLDYLGINPDVTILDKTATWPDVPVRGAPVLTNAPHFQIALGSALACGSVLPFRLEVTTGTGQVFDLDFLLKAGQETDYDMLADAQRRYNEQEASFWGTDPQDNFGFATAWGDINGDGLADLILSAAAGDSLPGAGRVNAGEVYLIYGKSTQWTDTDLATPPSGMARFWGGDGSDALGWSVASGDVNGDGFDDLILGAARGDSVGNLRNEAGEVYLVYGKAAQWTDADLLTPPAGVARFLGAETGDFLGNSVASGDVNGDGLDDLILGAPDGDSVGNARDGAGEVYLIYGKPTQWTDADLLTPPAGVSRFWGAEAGDSLGTSVATGDVNGDGLDELILGAWLGDSTANTRPNAGEAYLIYGKAPHWTDADLLAPPAGVTRFWGANDFDGLPSSVASGDVNGDGFDDLILGAYTADSVGNTRNSAGEVYLIYGKPTLWSDTDLFAPPAGVARFWGADGIDWLGWHVASGDVNGDGFDDLIVGAPFGYSKLNARLGAGEVYVIHGKSTPWSDTDLLAPHAGVVRFWGADIVDNLGASVSSGDVNGDGFDDLIMGLRSGDSTGNTIPDAGEVYLWYGKPTDTYYARPDTFAFIDATVGTKLTALACDDCSTLVPIGFSFPFYGEEFTTLHVSSNGLISFAPIHDAASAIPSCLPSLRPDGSTVAPFWDDLNPAAGGAGSGVFTLLQGTAPNRRLTIEWKDVPHYPAVGAGTFEVTLFESSGQILFQYQDLDFGSPSFDYGASASTGVENRKGAQGTATSCFDPYVFYTVSPAVRLVPSTPLVENRAESGAGLWTSDGLWHLSGGACEPDQHAGATSWYYGQELTCNYATGVTNSGALSFPTVPVFPADARLTYWSRRHTEAGTTFDVSKVQLSTAGTGGPFTDVQQYTDVFGVWTHAGVTNLFGHAGNTVDLRFFFDTIDPISNNTLGWMVDDVQLTGCNAVGVSAAAATAVAFAQPGTFCQGSPSTVDAVGSFCGDSGSPSSFQWQQDAGVIPGATGLSYAIPSSQPAGTYDFTVTIGCPGGAMAESAPAAVNIVAPPQAVGPTLNVVTQNNGADLRFTWTGVAGADDYVMLQDTIRNGSFSAVTGTASSGTTGLTVPMPPEAMVYYLVAGRNPVCGTGPKQ